MKRHAVTDTERNVLPEVDAAELARIARREAEQVFNRAAILALPAIRVQPSTGTHGYIEGQFYEFRCFESTNIVGQLLQVTDTDLLLRTLSGTNVVIPRRSVIVAFLEERDR